MKTKELFMPLNLQLFAETDGGQDTPPADNPTPPPVEEQEGQKEGKTFSRDDVAKMIAAEVKKARDQAEKEFATKAEQAKELAKMSATEKLQHQLEQIEKENAELKRGQALSEMTKEASKMLTDANVPHNDDLLSLIVSDDAEATNQAVSVIKAFTAQIKKENARQNIPSEGGQFSTEKNKTQSVAELAKANRIVK